MLTKYKKVAESILEPAVKPFAQVNPNYITLLGSIPSLLFFVAILNQQYILALLTSVLHLFDLVDGMVARRYKKVTTFGGFFDSTMDRVGDFLLITAFAFAGLVGWEIVAPLLLFAFLTSYIRAQGGVRSPDGADFAAGVGLLERTERIGLIFLGLLLYILFPRIQFGQLNLLEIVFLLLLVLSFYTVLQRFVHAYKKL